MAELKGVLLSEAKRIATAINGKRNWTSLDSATVMLRFILTELADGKVTAEEALSDDFKAERIDWINQLKVLATAGNNFQNTYLASAGLMPKVTSTQEQKQAEFA
jgi:hypothetical protein